MALSGGNRVIAALVVTSASLILSIAPNVLASPAATAPSDSVANTAGADTARVVRVFPTIEVTGSAAGSVAPPAAASQGLVTAKELAFRPLLRTGDFLESVPGLPISQHSGEGKANQYYLRGFNLDHGTDFATTVAGVPMNMPTHAHGQGYTDLSSVIPEVIGAVQYRKGTYSVEDGDFSSAGSAHISYRNAMPARVASMTAGDEGTSEGSQARRDCWQPAPCWAPSTWSGTKARGFTPTTTARSTGSLDSATAPRSAASVSPR